MKVIYSNQEIDGLEGRYSNPSLFQGVDKDATEVYTDDKKISDAYKKVGVQAFPLKKQTKKRAK